MKDSITKKIREEKAAVTMLVVLTVLTFVTVLLGAYLTVTTLEKSQLKSDMKIQQIYGRDVNRIDEIYEELVSTDVQKPTCQITYTVLDDTSILYQFAFSKIVKAFSVDDIKIYNATIVNTGFKDEITLSTNSPAYATTLTQNKVYAISFDYQCISGTQKFEIGLYSDTETDLPISTFIATEEVQHKDYRIEVTSAEAEFKILANIQENNNVTLSNLQIVEIQETRVENGRLVKQDNLTYKLTAPYVNNEKYVIILENGICKDTNGNDNDETIKVV